MIETNTTLPKIKVQSNTMVISQKSIKFRKLNLTQYQEQKNTFVVRPKIPKPQRSHSLMTSQSNRDKLKSNKVYLNLIEKKMNEGNYNETIEVSSDLMGIKKKCSEYSNEINQKSLEMQKLKKKIQEFKIQILLYSNNNQYFAKKINDTKQKYRKVRDKCQQITNEKSYLINMIQQRKADSINISGKIQQLKEEVKKLTKTDQILKRAEIQSKQKQAQVQSKYKNLINESEQQIKNYKKSLNAEDSRIKKRIDNQLNRQSRTKKLNYIAENMEIQQRQKYFNKKYDEYLANKFINRFLELKLHSLLEKNQRIIKLFTTANQSYGPFTEEEFPKRFFNLEPERQKIQLKIKQLEGKQSNLQKEVKLKKKKFSDLEIQFLSLSQDLQKRRVQNQCDVISNPYSLLRVKQAKKKYEIIEDWASRNVTHISTYLEPSKNNLQILKTLKSKQKIQKIIQIVRNTIRKYQNTEI